MRVCCYGCCAYRQAGWWVWVREGVCIGVLICVMCYVCVCVQVGWWVWVGEGARVGAWVWVRV